MKKYFFPLLFVALILALQGFARADGPSGLDGTETSLTAGQIAELQAWSKSTRLDLIEQLAEIPKLTPGDAIVKLSDQIHRAVTEGQSLPETLMRYALNRALKIEELLLANSGANRSGVEDEDLRILTQMTRLAIHYDLSDTQVFSVPVLRLNYARFGVDCADMLLSMNESTLSSEAQLKIARSALGFFEVDLARDGQSTELALVTTRLDQALKQADASTSSETARIRKLRKAYFNALTDIVNTNTTLGKEIRELLEQGKATHLTHRVVL